MYDSAVDIASLVGVGILHGPSLGDADQQAAFDSIEQLVARGGARTGVFVLLVEEGDHTPSAEWRRRFGGHRAVWENHRFALVTRSALSRGAMTAIGWITPSRDGQRSKAFADFEAARAWIEAELGAPAPRLPELYRRARAQAEKREAAFAAALLKSA